jgi:hypothetical protein
MADVTLDKVIEEVNALTPEDRVRLARALYEWLIKHFGPSLDTMLEEAKALPLEERAELWRKLQVLLVAYSQPSEDEFEQALSRLGILGDVRLQHAGPAAFTNRQPITLEGKPLSEQIIEERR